MADQRDTEQRGTDRSAPPLPQHVTAPLLTLVTQQALEEDYRSVAQRRAADGGSAPTEAPRSRTVAAAAIAVFGVLISVAAVQTSRNAEVDDAGRATLVARIGEERSDLEDTQAAIADVGRGNRELADALTGLTATRQDTVSRLRRLQLVTGYVATTGEGIRIVVDGNPNGDPNMQVTDSDLAKLVDGLWEAGAEAIAINDQRLNPLGPIRNTGTAVHVNTLPLSPPYVVRAIGNRLTLEAELANTTHGAEFFALAQQLGFVYDVENATELALPAARQRRLLYAQPGTAEQRDRGVEEGSS